jgi:putative transposase
MGLPKRKRMRLKGFDYSQNGVYFLTLCAKGKKKLFFENRWAWYP